MSRKKEMKREGGIWLLAAMGMVLLGSPAVASAGEGKKKGEEKDFLITVIDEENGSGQEWTEEFCGEAGELFRVRCLVLGNGADRREAVDGEGYRYEVELIRWEDGLVELGVRDRGRFELMRPVMGIANDSIYLEESGRWGLGALEKNLLAGPLGEVHSESRQDPSYWRAAFWMTKAMAWSTWWYLTAGDLNSKDWDYSGLYSDDPDLRPQIEKWQGLGGWRFDDNVMYLNTPLHPMAGAGYHILARSSRLGIGSSILASTLTSLFWEIGVEHHEVVSLNDLIVTGVGGIPLGEAYIQLGEFFRRGERTRLNQALSWLFGAPLQVHDLLDGTGTLYLGPRDEMGWPEDIWHRFRLEPGFSLAGSREGERARMDGAFKVQTELVRLPEYRRPSMRGEWQSGPAMTNLNASIAAGDEGLHRWGLGGELHFAGYYAQEIGLDDGGRRRGWSGWVGTGLGFRHLQHNYEDFLDRYGIVHFPGLTLDGSLFLGGVDLRVRYGFHPDFSTIQSRGLPEWEDRSGRRPGRTVLEDHGYYYGLGLSSLLNLQAGAGPFEVEASWDLHGVRSLQWRDRFFDDPERFGADLDGHLRLREFFSREEVGFYWKAPWEKLRLGVVVERRLRRGNVDDGAGSRSEGESRELRAIGVLGLDY